MPLTPEQVKELAHALHRAEHNLEPITPLTEQYPEMDIADAYAVQLEGIRERTEAHGGQIAVPGLPHVNVARLLISRFDRGTFTRAGSHLHVSRGVGTSGQPVRVGCPAEITTVSLVAPAA